MLLIVLNYYQSLLLHIQNNQSLRNICQMSCEHTRCCTVSAGGFCFLVVLTHWGQGKQAWELLAGSLIPFFLMQVMFYTLCSWSKRKGSDLHLLLMTHFGDWVMLWAFLILQVPPDTFLACSAELSWFYQASFPFCFVVCLFGNSFPIVIPR